MDFVVDWIGWILNNLGFDFYVWFWCMCQLVVLCIEVVVGFFYCGDCFWWIGEVVDYEMNDGVKMLIVNFMWFVVEKIYDWDWQFVGCVGDLF